MLIKSLRILILLTAALALASCASSVKKTKVDQENDPQYQYKKAVVAMNYNLEDQAIVYLNQALALDPAHFPALHLLGQAYDRKGNLSDAAKAFEKGLELQPENSDTHLQLGTVYEKLGESEKAEAKYKKAISIDGNPDAGINLAMFYFKQEKLEAALDAVRSSIETRDNSAQAFNLQGVILNKMKKVPEAITSFQQALKIDPKDVSIGVNLAIGYINSSDFEKAQRILETILPHVQDQSLKNRINEYLKIIQEKR